MLVLLDRSIVNGRLRSASHWIGQSVSLSTRILASGAGRRLLNCSPGLPHKS